MIPPNCMGIIRNIVASNIAAFWPQCSESQFPVNHRNPFGPHLLGLMSWYLPGELYVSAHFIRVGSTLFYFGAAGDVTQWIFNADSMCDSICVNVINLSHDTFCTIFATITAVAAKNSVGSPPDGIYPNAKKDNYIWAKRPGLISQDFLLFIEICGRLLPTGRRDNTIRKISSMKKRKYYISVAYFGHIRV